MKVYQTMQDYLKAQGFLGLDVIGGTTVRRAPGRAVWVHTDKNEMVKTNISQLQPRRIPEGVNIIRENERVIKELLQEWNEAYGKNRERIMKDIENREKYINSWREKGVAERVEEGQRSIRYFREQLKEYPPHTFTRAWLKAELKKASSLPKINKAYINIDGEIDFVTKQLKCGRYNLGRMIIRIGEDISLCNMDKVFFMDGDYTPHPWGDNTYSVCWGNMLSSLWRAWDKKELAIFADFAVGFLEEWWDFEEEFEEAEEAPKSYVQDFVKRGISL